METATTTPLTIDLPEALNSAAGERDRSSWAHRLVLKPRELTVEVWSTFGNGTPIELWNNVVIQLGTLPDGLADLSLIRDCLTRHEESLRALAGLHEVRWDGSNNAGHYTDDDRANDLAHEISEALDNTIIDVPAFWDASEWLGSTDDSDLFAVDFNGSPEAFEARAAALVREARGDAALNQTDVECALRRRWKDALDDAEIAVDDARIEITFAGRMIAGTADEIWAKLAALDGATERRLRAAVLGKIAE